MAENHARWREKVQASEAAQHFNQPSAFANFDHWAKLAYWHVDDRAACVGVPSSSFTLALGRAGPWRRSEKAISTVCM